MSLPVMFIVGCVLLVIILMLLSRLTPGSGAELLDWKPGGHAAERMAAEMDDFDMALQRHNEIRRKRGLGDVSEDDLRTEVADEQRRIRRDAEQAGQAREPKFGNEWDKY